MTAKSIDASATAAVEIAPRDAPLVDAAATGEAVGVPAVDPPTTGEAVGVSVNPVDAAP